jgi:ferredoxin-type protein NapG
LKHAATRLRRRRFLGEFARLGACAAGVAGIALALCVRRTPVLPIGVLRPPGALDEAAFSAACIRCGLCVRACPFGTLRLAGTGDAVAAGTPYFVARERPCEMCEDIPCAGACPTDALRKDLDSIRAARMGMAVLTGRQTCYTLSGAAHCRACWMACPLRGKALTFVPRGAGRHTPVFEPVVHADTCTGCGKCERACLTSASSIRVLPPDRAGAKGDKRT